jgi:nucleotide-binding universal stress UspA family protein
MKIVLAVDGSKYSRWATQWVMQAPFAKKPRVNAVHVLDLAGLRAPFMVGPTMIGYEPAIQYQARQLKKLAGRVEAETKKLLAPLKAKASVRIEQGLVALTILKHAGKGALVAIGQRGLSDLDRFFLGSVSQQVTLHAPCSVLVIKHPPRPIRRIMLAVDGSKSSDRALQFMLRELRPPKRQGIEVTVLHILPPFAYSQAALAGLALAHRYAKKLKAAGYGVKIMPRSGDPADEIVKVAKTVKADLLVAGAKGLSAAGRFLLGSVSTKLVRHSPCSILIVR